MDYAIANNKSENAKSYRIYFRDLLVFEEKVIA